MHASACIRSLGARPSVACRRRRAIRTPARLAASLAASLSACLATAALLGGCVEQTLTVDSNPAGAVVYLNDQEVGRTPMTVDFKWHGWYDVVIRKDGYQTLKTTSPVIAPIWNWVPLDLIAEILPVRLKDEQHLHYTLQPLSGQAVDPQDIIGRGEEMRTELETGVNPPKSGRPRHGQTTKPSQTKPSKPWRPAATQPTQPVEPGAEPAATAPASAPSTEP